LHRIAVGLDSKHEEEKQLRHTLSHILQLEKEKLRDEHRTTSTILKQIQKDHAEREKSMETLYVFVKWTLWFGLCLHHSRNLF
jgi:hypothetical protein